MRTLAPVIAVALLPALAACQEERINPLPVPDPVDMAWLQAEITAHIGAPAEPDAIAPVLEAAVQLRAIADEVRAKHEEAGGEDLYPIPDFGALHSDGGDDAADDANAAYADEVLALLRERGVWDLLDRADQAGGLSVVDFESLEEIGESRAWMDLRNLIRATRARVDRSMAVGDVDDALGGLAGMLINAKVASAPLQRHRVPCRRGEPGPVCRVGSGALSRVGEGAATPRAARGDDRSEWPPCARRVLRANPAPLRRPRA